MMISSDLAILKHKRAEMRQLEEQCLMHEDYCVLTC